MKKPVHVDLDFLAGEIVYHKTHADVGIVTGFKKMGNGSLTYLVSFEGRTDMEHMALELTRDKPIDGIPPDSTVCPTEG
jgi:hypothetical protein